MISFSTCMPRKIYFSLALLLLISCGRPSNTSQGNGPFWSNGFDFANLDRTVGNWATEGAFLSIRRTQGNADNLVMELTLLDLEKLTVGSKRFYHWLE